jgi:hypothetical protein
LQLRLTRPGRPQIATKVEIYTGTLPPGEADLRKVVMRRLGHLSFDRREKALRRAFLAAR